MSSNSYEPQWDWPEGLPGGWQGGDDGSARNFHSSHEPGAHWRSTPPRQASTPPRPTPTANADSNPDQQQSDHRPRRHYGPRTCRICLDVVQPTFETPSENLPQMLAGRPKVSYISEDGGRLIRPCLCKGSQKYVHEGCLAAWRLQDPNNKRNYWQCPTCKYSYRLERMTWAHWIGGTAAQIVLTLAIFLVATFALGYIADPIINLYLDPYTTVAYGYEDSEPLYGDSGTVGWVEHFAKGFASLGLLGFAKFVLTLSPWYWFNMRGSGAAGRGRAGTTGRDRLQQISWITVMVGVVTVLWAVWKGVRAWSKKTLTRASERVMDVPIADDGDDDED